MATLHGGVGLTMAKVREKYWVPRLRRLTKKVIKKCFGCKRFRAVAAKCPPPGLLPRTRTEGATPFNVIGVDFAGPVKYLGKGKKEGKAYVVLYSCSLTRGVFLELLPSLETREFLKSFKRLVARRGRPSLVYSDNGSTFVAAAKWLKKVRKDEELNEFLSNQSISWRFNLSRAPWWGGQFERLIGLMKAAFYKTVGGGILTWDELSEVLLDIEITINNRPLSYLEEDVQLPTLTPSTLLFLNSNYLPEEQPYHQEEKDLRKRAKFLKKTKEGMWRRWTSEYLRALRERHRLKHRSNVNGHPLSEGDVVIIESTKRNRNQWPLGIVESLIVGHDGVIRSAKLRSGKYHLERAIQHLLPLELSCDGPVQATHEKTPEATDPGPLNPKADVFAPRQPRRDAATAAGLRVQDVVEDEHLSD